MSQNRVQLTPTFWRASPSMLFKGSTSYCRGIGAASNGKSIKPLEPDKRSSPNANSCGSGSKGSPRRPPSVNHCAQRAAFIGFVGEHGLPWLSVEQSGGLGRVASLAGGDDRAQRPAQGIGEHVDLGRQSTSGTPQRLILGPPFSAGCLLVGSNDGAVDHQVLIVAVGGERGEHVLPHAGMTPAAEAAMYCLPLAVALRQIAPVGA
jgi:hypothetical protein